VSATPSRSSRRPPAFAAPAERLVAVLVFPGVTLLDVAAPLQVLGRLDHPFRALLVAERHDALGTDTPVALIPHATYDDVPAPEALIVPGGGLGLIRAMVDPGVTGYVAAAGARASIVGAACTGSLLLAAAGLLEGRQAATHWGYAPLLERLGARYRAERVVQDGTFITAAGGTAVVDMALRVAASLAGEAAARRIALALALTGEEEAAASQAGTAAGGLLGHLPSREAVARLASIRLLLAGRPDLLERLDV
jgi:transcriptional regulator GlxA family with amidase domain